MLWEEISTTKAHRGVSLGLTGFRSSQKSSRTDLSPDQQRCQPCQSCQIWFPLHFPVRAGGAGGEKDPSRNRKLTTSSSSVLRLVPSAVGYRLSLDWGSWPGMPSL